MAASRGYSSYRGRKTIWKILLGIVLVLVILAAVGFLLLQKYLVYDDTGTPRLQLPQKTEEAGSSASGSGAASSGDLNIIVEEPERGESAFAYLRQLNADPAAWQVGAEDDGVCVTVKASGGALECAVASLAAVSGRKTAPQAGAAAAALPALLTGEHYALARISCFRDSAAARANVDAMGLKNTGGYIFYDGNNESWLDPAKEAVLSDLAGMVQACAALGFDEILLTDVSYPTVGKLDKIAYGETLKNENMTAFLTAMRAALTKYPEVKLSIELPSAVISSGSDPAAGLILADIVPLVDGVYAVTTAAEAPALRDAVMSVKETCALIAEVTDPADMMDAYLLLA